MRIDEIKQGALPDGRRFGAQVDKEMTTFTGASTATTGRASPDRAAAARRAGLPRGGLPAAQGPAAQRAHEDLRTNNEEELGKERLQDRVRRHALRPPRARHASPGSRRSRSTTSRTSSARPTRAPRCASGSPATCRRASKRGSARRSRGCPRARRRPSRRRVAAPAVRRAYRVEIVEKETRATAISFGHPIAVTRAHPDFAALYLARTWLGEHRSSTCAPLPAHPRGARDELRRLRLHRGLPARDVPVLPRPQHRAARAALRGLDPAGGARERARWRCASRSTSCGG